SSRSVYSFYNLRDFHSFPTRRSSDLSYGDNSTVTLSPGNIRMKFIRIFPDTCARIVCSFSSSTLNTAFGNVSKTLTSTSITSSLDILLNLPSLFQLQIHLQFLQRQIVTFHLRHG